MTSEQHNRSPSDVNNRREFHCLDKSVRYFFTRIGSLRIFCWIFMKTRGSWPGVLRYLSGVNGARKQQEFKESSGSSEENFFTSNSEKEKQVSVLGRNS